MKLKQNKGFTLIELMVVTGILVLLVTMLSGVFAQNIQAWRVDENITRVSSSARLAQRHISRELQSAAFNAPFAPAPVKIGAGGTSVVFFVPLITTQNGVPTTDQDNDGNVDMLDTLIMNPQVLGGASWTTPITIQLDNEDLNGNFLLDAGEDVDANGRLDRRITRTQNDQMQVLANNINNLEFALTGDLLDVRITVQNPMDPTEGFQTPPTVVAFSINLLN